MRKITTLITACLVVGTGFAQEQREWKGGQAVGNLWDNVTSNWLDPNSQLPFPKSFAVGDFAIFGNKVEEGAETVTVVKGINTGGITYNSSKDIKLIRQTTTDFTTDFLSGDGVLTVEGAGIFAVGVENKLTGGSIVKSGVLRMAEPSIADNTTNANMYNPFGSKLVLDGGSADFNTNSGGDKQKVTTNTPIEIAEGKTGHIYLNRYSFMNNPIKGSGDLVIYGGGERTYLGLQNVAPDWSEFTGNVRVERNDIGISGVSSYGIMLNTSLDFDYDKFTGIDETFANRTLTIGSGVTILTESKIRAYAIGELQSVDETSQLADFYRDSEPPSIYYIVGGLNTDVTFPGKIHYWGSRGYNKLGFIKVGTGTYIFTNSENAMTKTGLEVREGKVAISHDPYTRGNTGGVGGPTFVKENGIFGGSGNTGGDVNVYGKFEPGFGIGTLLVADSLSSVGNDVSLMKEMNLNLYPGSVSEFEIKSKDAYDKVEVYGKVSFKSGEGKPTIKIVVPGAYNIQDEDKFEIISAFTCNDETIDFDIEYPTIEGVTWSYELVKLEEDNQNPRIPEGAALKFKVVVKATGSGTGIEDNKAIADVVTLYPNPTYSDFKVSASDVEINSVEVYNLQGQLVKTQVANESEVTVGVSEIPAGVYIVKVYTTSGITVQKLVKK